MKNIIQIKDYFNKSHRGQHIVWGSLRPSYLAIWHNELRDGDEITFPFVHLIFRPYLPDLQTQNPQNSSTIPAVLRIQIEQI